MHSGEKLKHSNPGCYKLSQHACRHTLRLLSTLPSNDSPLLSPPPSPHPPRLLQVIKQHELIIMNNKAAFPLANVLVSLSIHMPEMMDAMLEMLHEECILTIPAAYPHNSAGVSEKDYCKLMRYRLVDDPNTPGGCWVWLPWHWHRYTGGGRSKWPLHLPLGLPLPSSGLQHPVRVSPCERV